MYLLVFPSPNQTQISDIQSTFSNFDWERGFDVEEIVVNEFINGKLVIQFVSPKQFVIQKSKKKFELHAENISEVICGKEQFFGTLYFSGHDKLEAYFGYLGIASDVRDNNEVIYKVNISKYSELIQTKMKLEEILN
jgi:hypothetical protein